MATAAKEVPTYFIGLPSGEGDDRRAFISQRTSATVRLVEMVAGEEGGEVPSYTELGDVPLGTKEIYTQHRMCGDFYCFIDGAKQVAATGDTLSAAFLAARKLAIRA